jgi:hypothetical protein
MFALLIVILIVIILIVISITLYKKKSVKNRSKGVNSKLSGTQVSGWTPAISCPGGICAGLGEAFNLRKLNALNDPKVFLNGRVIFNDTRVGTCAAYSPGGKSNRSLVTTSDTRDLVSTVANNINIGGSFSVKAATVRPSITATTGYDVTQHSDIKTSYLDLSVESGNVYFLNNNACRDESAVNQVFLADFRMLPINVSDPGMPGSWAQYNSFFENWGTHIITQLTYGSKLQQWESTLGSSNEIDKTLAIKACAQIEGIGKAFTTNACEAYTEEEKRNALISKSNSNVIIIGGSENTREALQEEITSEKLDAFLKSSNESNQAVGVQFTPIWEVLKNYLVNLPDLQRALNLEAAFAFDATDCTRMENNGIIYQEFRGTTTDNITTYSCFAKKTGCTNKGDCHYSGGKAGCQSYGPSAFDIGTPFGDPSDGKFRTRVQGIKSGGINDGINNSCNYYAFKGCECNGNWAGGLPDRSLWEQGIN